MAPHAPPIQPAAEADFAEMARKYEATWKAQLDTEHRAAIQDQNVARHPGREWRRGRGHAAAFELGVGAAPRLYPDQPKRVAHSRSRKVAVR